MADKYSISPYAAYLLGLLTVFVILIPFWTLSMGYAPISKVYLAAFCSQALTYNSGS